MRVGRDKNNALIYSEDIDWGNRHLTSLTCPKCGGKLIIKRSKLGNIFFSHKVSCGCMKKEAKIAYNQGESLTHKAFKVDILEKCQRLNITVFEEYVLCSGKQIADIYICLDTLKIVLEYQQSKVSIEDIYKRHKQYQNYGLTPLWVIDETAILNNKSQLWVSEMIQYHSAWGYFILSWDKDKQNFYIRKNIPIYINFSKLKQSKICIRLEEILSLMQINNNPIHMKDGFSNNHPCLNSLIPSSCTHQYYIKKLKQIKMSSNYYCWLNFMYQYQMRLEDLPQWVFNPQNHIIGIRMSPWMFWILIIHWGNYYQKYCRPLKRENLFYFLNLAVKTKVILLKGLAWERPIYMRELTEFIWGMLPFLSSSFRIK